MNSRKLGLLLGIVLALSTVTSWGSDPVGVYAIVEKVVFEPSESAPQRIQVWGVFALADRARRGDYYLPAERGHLYYTLAPGYEEICRKEWADLKVLAGTGEAVAFGSRYLPGPRVHKATEKAETPDTYETNIGLMKLGNVNRQSSVIAGLREALQAQ